LAQLERLLHDRYGSWRNFGRKALDSTRKLQGDPSLGRHRVRRFLRLAWNTEYLLSAGGDEPEMLRLANHWAPVQGYYAVYCTAEAAAYALNGSPPGSHRKALRVMTDYFVKSGPVPWNFAYRGARGRQGEEDRRRPVNFPDGIEPAHNLQRTGVAPEQVLARCLRAEHGHRIDDTWEGKRRTGCYKYEHDPGDSGLLHFLYRLRTKANYKGVDLFLADVSENQVLGFNRGIQTFVDWTMLLLEVVVVRRIGKNELTELGEEYLDTNPEAGQLRERIAFYDAEV
jgi:hypothetical protein